MDSGLNSTRAQQRFWAGNEVFQRLLPGNWLLKMDGLGYDSLHFGCPQGLRAEYNTVLRVKHGDSKYQ